MSDVSNESLILASLLKNETYLRDILPHLSSEYFEDDADRYIYDSIFRFATKYNTAPDKSTLMVDAQNDHSLAERALEAVLLKIKEIAAITPPTSYEWLEKTTEDFCKNKAVFNAIHKAIEVYQGKSKDVGIDAIPDILSTAIAVNFDRRIGMDLYDDAALRYEYYANPATRLPFRIPDFNEITCGGVTTKTLNILLAATNVGKSLGLVSLSADYLRDGKDVLYVSCEMRSELVYARVEANLLGVPVNDVVKLGKDAYLNRIEALRQKSYGRMVVEEFPPGVCTSLKIKQLLDELRMKKGFVPHVIMCDYVQIMASYAMPKSVGSYYYYKSVAEEMRALAVEYDIAMWSASQFNRSGMKSTDAGVEDIAESTAIAMTADGMWGLIRTDELDAAGQILVKQLKTRYANRATRSSFVIGVDIDRQQLYSIDDSSQHSYEQAKAGGATTMMELKDKFQSFKT